MAEPVAATIYATQLTTRHEGYPLWEPDPRNEPPVEIADVGYIEKGAWVRLFNGSKPPGDRTNKFGVPVGYQPLDIGEIQERAPLPAKVPIQSESVVQRKGEVTVSGGMGTLAGGGFTFECSKEQGAVLLLGDEADRQDALRKEDFVYYILEHHASWLKFANNVRKRGIALNDLLLVTGCDKTSAWACAAFSSQASQAGVSFDIGQTGIVQGGVSLSWTSKNCSSVATRSGPSKLSSAPPSFQAPNVLSKAPMLLTDRGDDDEIMTEAQVAMVAPWMPPARNQCVFLRGYKMCDRRTAIARLLRRKKKPAYDGFEYIPPRKEDKEDPDAPGPSGPPDRPPYPSSAARGSSSKQGKGSENTRPSGSGSGDQARDQSGASGSSETNSLGSKILSHESAKNLDLYLQPNYDKEPTPLDIILEYILEKSKAELALAHDDDLVALCRKDGVFDDFEAWVYEVAPEIFVKNQVGMLETTYLHRMNSPSSKASTGAQPPKAEQYLEPDVHPEEETKPKRGSPMGSKNTPLTGEGSGMSTQPENKRKRGKPPKEKPAATLGEAGESDEDRPPKRPRGRPRKNPQPHPTNDTEGDPGPSTSNKRQPKY